MVNSSFENCIELGENIERRYVERDTGIRLRSLRSGGPSYAGQVESALLKAQPLRSPRGRRGVERDTGIEPASLAWEASVLPLY